MATKKYVSFNNLSKFLDNIKSVFATKIEVNAKSDKTHTHTISDVTNLQSTLNGKASTSHGTHVTYSTTTPLADGTAAVGSASTVARSDHRHPTDTSRAAQTSLDTHTSNTTNHITSTERANWNTAYTHSQSAHAPSNAEPNQNAFSNVKIGDVTIAADIKMDTLTLVAGNNITLTPDATNDKITISAKDTTYNLGSFGITATAAELNKLDGVTATATEINYINGVTSNIQNQLDGKAASSHTHKVANISDLTATAKELNYMDGVTSNVQTQLDTLTTTVNGKANASHTHSYAGSSSVGGDANNALKLEGYTRSNLYKDLPTWINAVGLTHTIVVEGDKDTYYPVRIYLPSAKTMPTYVSIHKNLGTQTPEIEGNHSNGTSSMWLIYEGRNRSWDGNGGYLKTWYRYMGYANLCSHADIGSSAVGDLIVWLRGGGCLYQVSKTANTAEPSIYYEETNIGTEDYPYMVAPRTDLGNKGLYSGTLGYGNIEGNATTATKATQDSNGNVIASTYETKTNASNKLSEAKSYADTAANKVKNDLLNGAGAAYDTLKELSELIIDNQDAIDVLENVAVGKANATHTHAISDVTNLQTTLNSKQATITGGASTIASSNLTTNRALISDGSGKVAVSAVTSTELGYLDGVTSNVQTQLNGKSASGHTHNYAGSSSAGGAANSAVKATQDASGNVITSTYATKVELDTAKSNLQTSINGKANSSHTHTIANVTNLQSTLDGKSNTSHNHIKLTGWSDSRTVATTPNTYNSSLIISGLKNNSAIGSPDDSTYSGVIGFRSWSDSSGGNAHEFAFTGNGNLCRRHGATTSWGSWQTILDSGNYKTYCTPANIGASATGHTHNYAGSSSVGGSATSAVKLDTSTAGDANTPVYFSGGKPVACTSLDLNTSGSSASCTGNSATATKLQTARTIGLGTGVTGTATSFNGTGNITIPVTDIKESYLSWGGKNIAGGVSPIDAACSNIHSANRFTFAKPAGITIEYSTNGSTYTAYSTTDSAKVNLVSGIGSAYYIGARSSSTTVNDKLRITLNATNMGLYTRLRKILINISTNYAAGSNVIIEKAMKGSESTYTTVGTYQISGWSGWNSIPLNSAFGGGSNQTSNIANIRLTFGITGINSEQTSNALTITDIIGIGDTYWSYPSTMAKTGHIYSYDSSQNVTFPAKVTGTTFVGALSGNATTATTASACSGNSATATKLATARTISLTGDVSGSTSFDGSGNASITATVADDSHNHIISNVDGLQSALDGKSATSHNHDSAYISKDLQFTGDNGGVMISYLKDDGKNVLDEIAALPTGLYTIYSQSGTAGNPKTTEAWRFVVHKTGTNTGWVQGYGSIGSVYTNYQDGATTGWRGWRCIWDNDPNPLWSGAMYMSSSNSTPQTVTPSKKLSECRTGWLLLWSDYDAGDGANDADFATTIIPKNNPSGSTWGGKSFLCDIPRYVGSNAEDVDTERRIIKVIYVHDDRIEGSYQGAYDERNDVVLRAVFEI